MLRFLAHRLALAVPTLVIASMIIFALQQLLPGDVATALTGEERDPEVIAFIREKYHLDQPLPVRYAYWAGGVVPAPGVAKLENEVCYLPLGEPDGSASGRVTRLSAAMTEAGLKAPVKSDIRAEIWTKMINSLTWNPIAVLTLANNGDIGKSAGAIEIARRMMVEAEAVAATFGATLATPMEKRIEFTVGLTDHKMSMLTDLQAGKPLEVAALADSIADLSELAKVPTPTIDMMLALLKLRATSSPSTA